MKSILRSTAILGSSSLVNILVGLLSAKAWALLLGPSGLGFLGLLQSLVGLAGLFAGMGIGTGVVRLGAQALAEAQQTSIVALQRAAWLLFWAIGGVAVLVMVMLRGLIGQWMLGGSQYGGYVVLMSVALLFTLASGIQTGILNAHHRVAALAKVGMLTSLLSTAASLAIVATWRAQGIGPAVLLGAVVGWVVSSYYLWREVGYSSLRPARQELIAAAQSLLGFGAPYTVSMLVGTGVQLALPALVQHTLNTESVGLYRAAGTISVSYLGFLLTAMAQDYYPRVAAVSEQPEELVLLVNQQHRLVMILAVPMILGVLALAPYLVPLIYTPRFYPAVEILEWQLIGDLLKFSSWTMAFVILARSGGVTFFCTELIAGITTITGSWLGMRWFGLAGLGMGFLLTYAVYYVVVWLIVHREIRLHWSRENKAMMLAALLAAAVVRLLPLVGLEALRTPVALALAVLAGSGSLWVIWHEMGGVRVIRAR